MQHFVWPGITFSWQAQYFRDIDQKNRKTHWYEAASSALNFPFLKEVSQNCLVSIALQLQLPLHVVYYYNYKKIYYATLHNTNYTNYTTLPYTTLHSTTLYCTTLHSTTLHYTTLHYTTPHHTTLHYTTLRYTTLQYSTVQHSTVQYSTRPDPTRHHHHHHCYNYNYNYNHSCTTLRYTTLHYTCNFSSLIWPDGSAPAALASLLFDPPEPQIIGKT